MQWNLSFNPDNEKEVWKIVGATSAVFLLIRGGYISWKDAEECFGKPEFQWRQLYRSWCKANGVDK